MSVKIKNQQYEKEWNDLYHKRYYYDPYNFTGNYLKKKENNIHNGDSDYELVKDNMVLYIYLDKYKSKKQVEDGPYGFYIINHPERKKEGYFLILLFQIGCLIPKMNIIKN